MILTARVSSGDRKTTCTPRAFKLRKAKSVSDFEAVAALCASEFASSGSISDINQSQSESAIAQIVRSSLGVVSPGSSNKQPTDDLFERLIELDRRKKEAQVLSCSWWNGSINIAGNHTGQLSPSICWQSTRAHMSCYNVQPVVI